MAYEAAAEQAFPIYCLATAGVAKINRSISEPGGTRFGCTSTFISIHLHFNRVYSKHTQCNSIVGFGVLRLRLKDGQSISPASFSNDRSNVYRLLPRSGTGRVSRNWPLHYCCGIVISQSWMPLFSFLSLKRTPISPLDYCHFAC